MEHKNVVSVEKTLTIVAFIFLTLTICVIVLTPPATGYEKTIYDVYPIYFWFFIMAAVTCGVFMLLYETFAGRKSKGLLTGLFIIIIAYTVFLLLPKFRGYTIYGRGDLLTHLGLIRDIQTTGHTGESNFYPIMHIIGTFLTQLPGVSIENIPYLFFVLFFGIYIANMYLLARSVSDSSGQAALILVFASPLIYSFFHVNIHPSFFSVFIIPCLLHLYHKKEQLPQHQRQNTLLLFLLTFFITFFHPVTALYVIAVFFTFGLARAFFLSIS